jgi:hypothetical protein
MQQIYIYDNNKNNIHNNNICYVGF